jgi:hypothetical protein
MVRKSVRVRVREREVLRIGGAGGGAADIVLVGCVVGLRSFQGQRKLYEEDIFMYRGVELSSRKSDEVVKRSSKPRAGRMKSRHRKF